MTRVSGKIQYKKLDADCFNAHSLDSFVRHQTVNVRLAANMLRRLMRFWQRRNHLTYSWNMHYGKDRMDHDGHAWEWRLVRR